MRRLRFCLFLFVFSCVVCAAAGLGIRRQTARDSALAAREESLAEREESLQAQEESLQEELAGAGLPAANQRGVTGEYTGQSVKEEYYLVCEDGFLLVFLKDRKTICLYTHIPITDFPESERSRIREGIWFPGMLEVFHYLESYTS